MSNVGFAACSMLTLGWLFLCIPPCCGGCTGGGTLGLPDGSGSLSYSGFMMSLARVAASGWPPRWLRVSVDSFCGGAGGCSGGESGVGALSPNGPSGPRESSRASSLVVCIGMRRIGPLERPGPDFAGVVEDVPLPDCPWDSKHAVSFYQFKFWSGVIPDCPAPKESPSVVVLCLWTEDELDGTSCAH